METKQAKFLFKRQKVLLALIQAFGGSLPKVDLQKYLFLYTHTYEEDKSYEFVPHKMGCYSFQSHADRQRLKEFNIIADTKNWKLATKSDYISQLESSEQEHILSFAKEFKDMKGRDLIWYVYRHYPYYAINSEIAGELMNFEERGAITKEREKVRGDGYKFFTIGYEGQSLENYLTRLIVNDVKVLCDVRKNPLSRKFGFSKSILSNTLNELNIEYIHIPELGIESENRQSLNTQEDYDRLFDNYEKTTLKKNRDAIDKLYRVFLDKKRVAITCFEAEHCMCHRSRVAKALSQHPEWRYTIEHI